MLDRLALRLVDGHHKTESNRELPPRELKWDLILCWPNRDARNKDGLSSMVPSKQPNLQHPIPHPCDDTSAAVADSVLWIQIAKDHERTSDLESEVSKWKPGAVDGVEILDRIQKLALVLVLSIVWNGVCTVEDPWLAREEVENGSVKVIHIVVPARKDGAL